MEFMIDSLNIAEIKKWAQILPLAGITSNPTIAKKEGAIDFFAQVKTVRQIIGPTPSIHVQVVASDYEGIIADAHKLKESDLLFLDAVVKKIPDIVLIVSSNKRNFVVDKNRDDFSLNRLFCKYKIKPLSLLSSFSYIKNCVFNAFTATGVKRKNLFSFLSMFFIYIFSGGKISYINKISFNCLNLIFNENKRKVSFVSVFKVVFKNNMSVRYNVIILLFKFCVLFGSIFILTCGSYIFYNKYNDAKIDKIRQEIEMHNMQLEIID